MSEIVHGGINVTDVMELDGDIKIVVDGAEDEGTAVTTSVSTENSESRTNLQVSPKILSTDGIQDIHSSNKRERYGSRGSITSFLNDVLTPKQVTKVIKLRSMATLTITILTVLLLFLTPIVFYNINPPTMELYSFDGVAFKNVDFETCSVSVGCTNT